MNDLLQQSLQRALGTAYRLDRELGGGGMSRVFVAHDLTLDRDVVVKVLSEEFTSGLSSDRFRREIQVIARLQHPHIVSILSAGDADGALYYVMPFVRGETLRARLNRDGALRIADVVKLLRETLDALAFAHDEGIVHRDIKPENVLLEAGHALVADFGIAKALRESGNLTTAGVAIGTPAYMAPEQATADPTTDHRADLYSVGVLAYELLVGNVPFTGSAQQIITAHITTPAPPVQHRRADVPAALADLVARSLAKEPSARPQNAREMLAMLDAASALAPSTPGGAARADVRKRWPRAAGAIAVAAIAIVGAIWVRAGAGAEAPQVADGAELIAVMPLGAASDSSLARLGNDLAVTISANLDGVGALRSIDAATLLMRARTLPSPMPLLDAEQLAKELGARSVMTGTLVREGSRVRATVALRLVGSDSTLAKGTALAPAENIAALTDSLSWALLQGVWRKGDKAPSPLLAGLTTASFDALRAFLDGEARFQRLDSQGALNEYRRAFELDSNFAQAYLRYDYVNDWMLRSSDSVVHRRLLALTNKLPERERLWVDMRERELPLPARVAAWTALSQRYPDYPPFLMAAADPIVHFGPIHGIPISDARPMLDRLDQLVPDHADTQLHQAILAGAISAPAEAAEAFTKAGGMMSGAFGAFVRLNGDLVRAHAAGTPMPPVERGVQLAQAWAAEGVNRPGALTLAGVSGFPSAPIPYQLEIVGRVRRAGIHAGAMEKATGLGEGALLAARGNWAAAMEAAQRTDDSALPVTVRMAAARIAALGAWLQAVDVSAADRVVRDARASMLAIADRRDRAELLWLDGTMGIVLGDEQRVRAAVSALAEDTLLLNRHTGRSLTGLWLHRSDPDAAGDSLRAVTDDVMRTGQYVVAAEALNRLVIARLLRKRDQPSKVERYLMWPDGGMNSPAAFSVSMAVGPVTAYERASAAEAAGDRAAAIRHYRTFVERYDQPPPAHRAMVDDGKQRLAALLRTDASKATAIPK
ncbi:MAG: serine/threonine-protein kinase [Gemmatimonadota bacterium]